MEKVLATNRATTAHYTQSFQQTYSTTNLVKKVQGKKCTCSQNEAVAVDVVNQWTMDHTVNDLNKAVTLETYDELTHIMFEMAKKDILSTMHAWP